MDIKCLLSGDNVIPALKWCMENIEENGFRILAIPYDHKFCDDNIKIVAYNYDYNHIQNIINQQKYEEIIVGVYANSYFKISIMIEIDDPKKAFQFKLIWA